MIVKLKTLVESVDALNEFSGMKMPAKTAYRSGRILRNINDEVNEFYKVRDKLIIEKYGVKNEDGTYNVALERIEEYKAELMPLLDDDVHIDGCSKISIEDIADTQVTPEMMIQLDWMLE